MRISVGQGPQLCSWGRRQDPSQGVAGQAKVRTGRRRQALTVCQVPGTNYGFAPSQLL